MSDSKTLLTVSNLETAFHTDKGAVRAVDDVSFSINEGETYGLVGESGAGKSVTALSILGLIDPPGRIEGGTIEYDGQNLAALTEDEIRHIRGDEIAMVFQDPMTALNPGYTVGEQIIDVLLEHTDLDHAGARDRTIELLSDVGIPDPAVRIDNFPHQFSGGMRQRALIAMALSCNPDLLIADEPTTALDVTIQAQILELLKDLQDRYNMSILLITHDMGVVAQMCDRVGVMYAGKKVEDGPIDELFTSPRHPYTVGLMKSIPRIDDPRIKLDMIPGNMPDLIETPSGCSFRDRCPHASEMCAETQPPLEPVREGRDHASACLRVDEIDFEEASIIVPDSDSHRSREIGDTLLEVNHLRKHFTPESQGLLAGLLGEQKKVHAVDDVSLSVRAGETLGLVGESGCGKTTLGRTLIRLYEPNEGTILYAGENLTDMDRSELKQKRSELQVIFQDPFSSLNPRKTVKNIIGRPLEIHGKVSNEQEKEEQVIELLKEVGLKPNHLNRYPHEFSGGQKQRIGIARALAVEPDFIIADEPVSALDVSVQAKILNLLMDLQDRYGLTYIFIAHDLNVVQHIADRVAVMYLGEIVELGSVDDIFTPPYHPYTEVLLSSIPQPDPDERFKDRIVPEGTVPSPIDPPSGCRFHTRCPYAMAECSVKTPQLIDVSGGHAIHCHLFDEAVMDGKDGEQRQITDRQQSVVE